MSISAANNNSPAHIFAQFDRKNAVGDHGKKHQSSEDMFLKLMVTELRNQSPTKPLDNKDMLAQLAQFSAVSGIRNLQKTMVNLADSLMSNQALQAASLVGRHVLVAGDKVHLGEAGKFAGAVELAAPAKHVVVGVYDGSGHLVKQIKLGHKPAGMADFSWDGKNEAGKKMPAGIYSVRAEEPATGNGKPQHLDTLVRDRVASVTMGQRGGEITLGLADGGGAVALSKVREIS